MIFLRLKWEPENHFWTCPSSENTRVMDHINYGPVPFSASRPWHNTKGTRADTSVGHQHLLPVCPRPSRAGRCEEDVRSSRERPTNTLFREMS